MRRLLLACFAFDLDLDLDFDLWGDFLGDELLLAVFTGLLTENREVVDLDLDFERDLELVLDLERDLDLDFERDFDFDLDLDLDLEVDHLVAPLELLGFSVSSRRPWSTSTRLVVIFSGSRARILLMWLLISFSFLRLASSCSWASCSLAALSIASCFLAFSAASSVSVSRALLPALASCARRNCRSCSDSSTSTSVGFAPFLPRFGGIFLDLFH